MFLLENTHASHFEDVKMFAADPWYNSLTGKIRRVSVETACDYPDYIVNGQLDLKRNNLITVLPCIGKEYKISFDVFISKFIANWQSIIHFTVGEDNAKYGDRTPGVWISNQKTFYICSALNGNKDYCFKSTNVQQLGKWINVEISQTFVKDQAGRYIDKEKNLIHKYFE